MPKTILFTSSPRNHSPIKNNSPFSLSRKNLTSPPQKKKTHEFLRTRRRNIDLPTSSSKTSEEWNFNDQARARERRTNCRARVAYNGPLIYLYLSSCESAGAREIPWKNRLRKESVVCRINHFLLLSLSLSRPPDFLAWWIFVIPAERAKTIALRRMCVCVALLRSRKMPSVASRTRVPTGADIYIEGDEWVRD